MHDDQRDLLEELLWHVDLHAGVSSLEPKGSARPADREHRARRDPVPTARSWRTHSADRCWTAIMFLWILCFVTALMTAAAALSHWFWRGGFS